MVIVAHNEAAHIGAKLENILSLDYPHDRFDVVVASDGSNDETETIVRGYADRKVKLLSLPRQGKIPALNAAVAAATGEVLVFSDANSMYAPDALRALVRPLADPHVGGVAGDQRYFKERGGASAGEHTYWNFDRMLKQAQSAAGNVISATGAIYAVRRSLFRTVPSGVTDDFAVSTAVIAQGYRLVFASDAAAYEPAAKASGIEFGRKTRVMTRGLRGALGLTAGESFRVDAGPVLPGGRHGAARLLRLRPDGAAARGDAFRSAEDFRFALLLLSGERRRDGGDRRCSARPQDRPLAAAAKRCLTCFGSVAGPRGV
jgi:glycosyltransferase involved in cell wall biosynthesis